MKFVWDKKRKENSYSLLTSYFLLRALSILISLE